MDVIIPTDLVGVLFDPAILHPSILVFILVSVLFLCAILHGLLIQLSMVHCN